MGETALGGEKSPRAIGWVAAQRQDVVDPGAAQSIENAVELVDRRVDTGQVRNRLDVELALDAADELHRTRPHRAARAIGDRHEGGLEVAQT